MLSVADSVLCPVSSVAEQELQNAIKRMEIYKKANEVLRKQVNTSLNPEKVNNHHERACLLSLS